MPADALVQLMCRLAGILGADGPIAALGQAAAQRDGQLVVIGDLAGQLLDAAQVQLVAAAVHLQERKGEGGR